MTLIFAFVGGDSLQRIITIGDFLDAFAVQDHSGSVHLITLTGSSIRCFDINGNEEWIRPRSQGVVIPKDLATTPYDFVITLRIFKNDSLILYINNISTGESMDSIATKLPFSKAPPVGLVNNGNLLLMALRRNSPNDIPRVLVAVIKDGKFKKYVYVSAGFTVETSTLYREDCALLGTWVPLNLEAAGYEGISDIHPAIIMVSLSSGKVINRFMLPFNEFSRSKAIISPSDSTVIVPYRSNYRNKDKFSGIYKLSLPSLEPISHWEIIGNGFSTDQLLNGKNIAVFNSTNDTLYIVEVTNLHVDKLICLDKYISRKHDWIIPGITVWRVQARLIGDDITGDGVDDVVMILSTSPVFYDPRWSEIYDRYGNVIKEHLVVILQGPDFRKIYPIHLNYHANQVIVLPRKKLIIGFNKRYGRAYITKVF